MKEFSFVSWESRILKFSFYALILLLFAKNSRSFVAEFYLKHSIERKMVVKNRFPVLPMLQNQYTLKTLKPYSAHLLYQSSQSEIDNIRSKEPKNFPEIDEKDDIYSNKWNDYLPIDAPLKYDYDQLTIDQKIEGKVINVFDGYRGKKAFIDISTTRKVNLKRKRQVSLNTENTALVKYKNILLTNSR